MSNTVKEKACFEHKIVKKNFYEEHCGAFNNEYCYTLLKI